MSLRKKTLIIVGLTLVCLIAILYAVSRFILLDSFSQLERRLVQNNVYRVKASLDYDLATLSRTTNDWAAWDDTYAFIVDANESYIKANLVDSTFITLRLNLIMFIDSSGRVVFGRAFDLHDEKSVPVMQDIMEHLTPGSMLLTHTSVTSSVSGIVLLPEGPLLISSWPVLTSKEEGPIRGTLLFGRYLNSYYIRHLFELTRLSLSAYRFDDPRLPSDFSVAKAFLSGTSMSFIHPLDAQSIAGYTLLTDIYGKPAVLLRTDMPRDVYKHGQTSIFYFILLFLAVGLIFSTIILLLLERQVLSRLARLSQYVDKITTSGNLSIRLKATGKDELALLAGEINKLLEAQQQAEKMLQAFSLSDELTGLYNRRGFITLGGQQMKITARAEKSLLLIFADLDDLKGINDTFGHLEGDRALVDTSQLLRETFRESDIIARIGGDEFAVLTVETPDAGAEAVLGRLKKNLETRKKKYNRRYTLSLSVGTARYDPEQPSTIEELLARADRSMYEKKQRK